MEQLDSPDRTFLQPAAPRELGITVLVWTAIAVAAMGLNALSRAATGGTITLGAIAMDTWLITLWALATPLVVRSAARFPVRRPRAIHNTIVHFVIGSVFIVATNAIIRVPLLARGDIHGFIADITLGIATYYPGAIISYGVLVAVGHRLFVGSALDKAQRVADEAQHPSDESQRVDVDGTRLVIREWNRVHFINLDDIEWIEANDNHVVVHTPARTFKGRERIGDVEARLDGRQFVRVHRSAIVHLPRIREVQPLTRGDHAIVLRSGTVVRVARSRRQALEAALGMTL